MKTPEPGFPPSVDETYRLIAQARRLRSQYLRASLRQFVAWIARRLSRKRPAGKQTKEPAENGPSSQAKSQREALQKAA
jgi:hypothetical protein